MTKQKSSVLQYLKIPFFLFKREQTEESPIGEHLTKEQKKKYRKQYIGLMASALLISFVYIVAIAGIVEIMFKYDGVFFISVVFLLMALESFINKIDGWGLEMELIIERIKKRSIKNIRQFGKEH